MAMIMWDLVSDFTEEEFAETGDSGPVFMSFSEAKENALKAARWDAFMADPASWQNKCSELRYGISDEGVGWWVHHREIDGQAQIDDYDTGEELADALIAEKEG